MQPIYLLSLTFLEYCGYDWMPKEELCCSVTMEDNCCHCCYEHHAKTRIWAIYSAQLAAGRYTTLDDLVGEALALLVQWEQRLDELSRKIAVGTEQVRNGQVTDGEAVSAQLQEKLDRMTQSNSWIPTRCLTRQFAIAKNFVITLLKPTLKRQV